MRDALGFGIEGYEGLWITLVLRRGSTSFVSGFVMIRPDHGGPFTADVACRILARETKMKYNEYGGGDSNRNMTLAGAERGWCRSGGRS